MEIKDIRQSNLIKISSRYESQRVFADVLEWTPGFVNQLITGHRGIGEKTARKIEKKLGLYHLALDEIRLIDSINVENEAYTLTQTRHSNADWLGSLDLYEKDSLVPESDIELPYFREIELGAGTGRYEVVENNGRKIRFPISELKARGIQPSYAACVKVSGNSMSPVYPDGCIVGIDTSKTEIKDGDHYAIDHNGHLRVKMLYRLPNGGLRLRSFNDEEWPDEPLSAKEKALVRVIGRVFWVSSFR